MIFLEIPGLNEIHDPLTWENIKVPGILVVISFAFGITIIYMYKEMKSLHKIHAEEIKELNRQYMEKEKEYAAERSKITEVLIRLNDKYSDGIKMLTDALNKRR